MTWKSGKATFNGTTFEQYSVSGIIQSVAKIGTGDYEITLNEPFTDVAQPVIIADAFNSEALRHSSHTPTTIKVITSDSDTGNAADSAFVSVYVAGEFA